MFTHPEDVDRENHPHFTDEVKYCVLALPWITYVSVMVPMCICQGLNGTRQVKPHIDKCIRVGPHQYFSFFHFLTKQSKKYKEWKETEHQNASQLVTSGIVNKCG